VPVHNPPPGTGRKARHEETRTAPTERGRVARTAVATAPDARPVDIALAYVRDHASAFGLTSPDLRAEESIAAAAAHLAKAPGEPLSEQPVVPRLMYEPLESGDVVLGWHVEIDDPESTHYWAPADTR